MQQERTKQFSEFLSNLSIEELNEMQLEFIQKAESFDNLLLLAPTGSGKTIAFLIPLIQNLQPGITGVQALIVVPSRELALQIEQVFRMMKTSYKVSCCYGGHSVKTEQNAFRDAPALIIGTPGRLADHIDRKSFDPETIQTVVLDEFDKSLQFGFHDQLKIVFEALTGTRRHLLTSATRLAVLPDFLPFSKPATMDYIKEKNVSNFQLKLVHTSSIEKAETLMRLVAEFKGEACLVFCNHRDAVDRISLLLTENDRMHGVLHGGMEQIDREKNLIRFRSGANYLLIATDLASRGLDIPEIRHVVHYQLPPKKEAFIHRNGRTARMHAEGQGYLVLANEEKLPDYIDQPVEEITVSEDMEPAVVPLFECVYISAGKKDKISKGDIVGFFTKNGGLEGSDIGNITILDLASYVAIKRHLVKKALTKLNYQKLKKVKVKLGVAN